MTPSTLSSGLTKAEIQTILAGLYGNQTTIIASRLLKGGLFNTTYWVKTNQHENGVVLRVAPANQSLLFEFEKNMMSAEPLFYRLLHEKGIPTSKLLRHDNSRQLINREYIIFDYIPSVPMNDPSVPQQAKPSLYRRLGKLTSRLHEIQGDQFGWKRPKNTLPMHATWGAFLHHFAQEIAAKASKHALFADQSLSRFLHIFARHNLFDEITQPRLIHADLWEGNVLVSYKQNQWMVAAIIDIDKAIFGDVAFEFAAPSLDNAAFWQGYRRPADNSPAAQLRQTAYRLLYAFMSVYIWSIQFENPIRAAAAKQDALLTLDMIEQSETFTAG